LISENQKAHQIQRSEGLHF